jgi:hypothetical protein
MSFIDRAGISGFFTAAAWFAGSFTRKGFTGIICSSPTAEKR